MSINTRDSPEDSATQEAEVHHRFMNIFAMVQAIIRLTDNTNLHPEVEKFRQKLDGRVGALGLAQHVLTESGLRSASLRQLMNNMLAPFNGHPSDKRFHLYGEEYDVWPKAAETLSFAAYELANNSTKYGALSKAGGYVNVRWHVDNGLRQLTFSWQDVDGPPVALPLRQGFGSNFIRRQTEALHGTLTMTFEPHGAACTICIPLPGATPG